MLSIHGDDVTILNQGLHDSENPFLMRHAEVELNGHVVYGDVVFTETIKDYYKANFHCNSRLNRCVIHIAERDEFSNLRVRLQNGKTITTVINSNEYRRDNDYS